jgi:hypothetical protein
VRGELGVLPEFIRPSLLFITGSWTIFFRVRGDEVGYDLLETEAVVGGELVMFTIKDSPFPPRFALTRPS